VDKEENRCDYLQDTVDSCIAYVFLRCVSKDKKALTLDMPTHLATNHPQTFPPLCTTNNFRDLSAQHRTTNTNMGAKSKHPKKKGPKGKKARAKAKLDQVWGESVDEDARKASKLRFGKSRLMPEVARGRADGDDDDKAPAANRVRDSQYDGDNSSSGSEDDEAGNSFSHFLKRIRHPENDEGMDVDSSESSDGESDHDAPSETESDDESTDDAIGTDALPSQEDPFEAHFSKEPLPQLDDGEKKKTKLVALTHHIRKVNTSMLHSALDVHLSGPLLDQWTSIEKATGLQSVNGEEAKKCRVRRAWEYFAKGPYGHAREVLTRNWREVNQSYIRGNGDRVFSSLQLALYPAISRYADVLMTAETRQVR
jgi:hypothetical protein